MAYNSWLKNPMRTSQLSNYMKNRQSRNKEIELDLQGDLTATTQKVLGEICSTLQEKDKKKLHYLNDFVKIAVHLKGDFSAFGYSSEEILICLRTVLLHLSADIRSGGLRAIRYSLNNEEDVCIFNKLNVPYLVARSLDLVLKNEVERIEALKLMRRILAISPSNFDIALSRSLVALANGGIEEKNRMLRSCLGTLSELGVLNPQIFIKSGGVAAVTRNLLECQTPKIAESLCGVLLLLLDKPATRNYALVDLHCVAAPYCDFHYRHGWKDKNRRDERELRFHSSRRALLTMLRSWPGILHFCSPSNKVGLKAIVEALYLDQLEVRKGILDLLYELFGLPQPEWTDELSVALSAIDPCEPQSSWRLNEGFVVAEGKSILPHLSKTTPNIIEIHIALLLYCFLENGLLKALTEVIATGDTFISVRATVLLGEVLRLIQILLPVECYNLSPPLPALLEYAATDRPQALGAITALQQLHKLLKRRPASYSLHLDYILKSGCSINFSCRNERNRRTKHSHRKSKFHQLIPKEKDSLIKETGVLTNKDPFTWDWNTIKIILREENEFKVDFLESSHKMFINRLVEFYMPSNNRYSHMDLSTTKISHAYTTIGIDLIKCLLYLKEPEAGNLLLGLFKDILNQVKSISASKSVHDCLFSPQHMINTHCQSYFLFIGRIGTTEKGINLLNSINMFETLESLATTTNNDCYVKVILSSLDYSNPGPSRELLATILSCSIESSRLYATQFLLVLLRAGIPNFATWGIPLLIKQLNDQCRSIYLSAISTLHEACEISECLETLIKQNPDLSRLGEKGNLLLIRFLSIITGFELLNKNDFVVNEIKKWDDGYNLRYVKLIEEDISDALTLHQRSEDGRYDKRTSPIRTNNKKDLYLQPHLYGQLTQHVDAFTTLVKYGSLDKMMKCILHKNCETDEDILEMKASLWAIGHVCTSDRGFQHISLCGVIGGIINLAQNSDIYSIRATAFYVLCLISTTAKGAEELSKLGWVSTRHDRHNCWPIIEEGKWYKNEYFNIQYNCTGQSSQTQEPLSPELSLLEQLELKEEEDESKDIAEDLNMVYAQPRSSTLPSNRKSSSGHQRSLSESTTFEMIREKDCNDDDWPDCYTRNSLDSYNCSFGDMYRNANKWDKTLSPVPSNSSSHIINSGRKHRRYSESCRRISTQSTTNSDNSSLSVEGSSNLDKLDYQDLLGYATIRSLRRKAHPLPDDDFTEYKLNDKITFHFFKNIHSKLFQYQSGMAGNENLLSLSLSSLSSVKRFNMNGTSNTSGQLYLGICLPKMLTDLFPVQYFDSTSSLYDISFPYDLSTDLHSHLSTTSETPNSNIRFGCHCSNSCLKCCINKQQINETEFHNDLLRYIEYLANPGWSKQVKQGLLELKQKNNDIFQDICLYSEVCKMLTENTYRLPSRRMVHELFFDIKFETLASDTTNIVEKTVNSNETPRTMETKKVVEISTSSEDISLYNSDQTRNDSTIITDNLNNTDKSINRSHSVNSEENDSSLSSLSTSIKRLESLRLTYKENKFPIRNKVPQRD